MYTEHSGAVYAFAYHLLGSREDAEDVTQIAFMHAHRALVRGQEIANPRAWLATIVKRQVFNRWRDRRETPAEVADAAAPAMDSAAAEQLSQVRAVLFSLPEAQHQAFVLRHWCGLGQSAIAEVLGTTESAVESLLVRARSTVLASDPVADICVDVRGRLAAGDELRPAHDAHVQTCAGCSRAYRRLTRVAAAAVVLGIVPRAHVAQALAASVPGFAASSGVAGAGIAAKATGIKIAASVLATTAAATALAPVAEHVLPHHRVSVPAAPGARARRASPPTSPAITADQPRQVAAAVLTPPTGEAHLARPRDRNDGVTSQDSRQDHGSTTDLRSGSGDSQGSGDGGAGVDSSGSGSKDGQPSAQDQATSAGDGQSQGGDNGTTLVDGQ